MSVGIRIVRPTAALLVIAHGWAHAVLPLRGFIASETLGQNFMPMILYGVAMLGFSAAGIGIIGNLAIRRCLPTVAGGGVGIFACGPRDSRTSRSVAGRPDRHRAALGRSYGGIQPAASPTSAGVFRRVVYAAAAVAFMGYTFSAVLWPVHRTWGTQPAEYSLALAGDDAGRRPALEIQHAVTVHAPASAVWPWLLQLGQDRAGFYSYDWLERAFGVDVHNVAEIRPEWQHRGVGELVRATQPDYLGGIFGPDLGWQVLDVQSERALVLEHWGTFALVPTDAGTTRFIIRTPVGHERIPVWAATLDMMTFQLPHFIMERRMMLRIKALAESSTATF